MNAKQMARKRFMMFSCTIMSREEHIKSRPKWEHQKDCKLGVKEIWSPIAINHECIELINFKSI